MGTLGPDLRATGLPGRLRGGRALFSTLSPGWATETLSPSLKNTRLGVHNLQTLSSQRCRKFPETPQLYLIWGSHLWAGLLPFCNAKPGLPSLLGTLRRTPWMPREGWVGLVIPSASNYWFWPQNQELLTTNPLEQKCPNILSVKRRKMCSEQGIQTETQLSQSCSLLSRMEESQKGFKQRAKHQHKRMHRYSET